MREGGKIWQPDWTSVGIKGRLEKLVHQGLLTLGGKKGKQEKGGAERSLRFENRLLIIKGGSTSNSWGYSSLIDKANILITEHAKFKPH